MKIAWLHCGDVLSLDRLYFLKELSFQFHMLYSFARHLLEEEHKLQLVVSFSISLMVVAGNWLTGFNEGC